MSDEPRDTFTIGGPEETPAEQNPPSQFIGLVIGTQTHTVYAVLNPKDDAELGSPRHVATFQGDYHTDEPVELAKVERNTVETATSISALEAMIDARYGSSGERALRPKAADSLEPMVGMVVGTTSRMVYTLTNPTENAELDNPRLLLVQGEEPEPMMMVIVPRGAHSAEMTPDDVVARITQWYAERALNSPPDEGPDTITA
jgi:hypothetical protein